MKNILTIGLCLLSLILCGNDNRATFKSHYELKQPLFARTLGVLMNAPQLNTSHLKAFSKSFEDALVELKITSKVFDISEDNEQNETERMMFIFNDFAPDIAMSMKLSSNENSDHQPRQASIKFLLKKKNGDKVIWSSTAQLTNYNSKLTKSDFKNLGEDLVVRMLEDGVISSYSNSILNRIEPVSNQEEALIHIHINGKSYGPYNKSQIDDLLNNNRVHLQDWAWRKGESQWRQLHEVIGQKTGS